MISKREANDDVYYSLEKAVYKMEQEFLKVIAIVARDFYGPVKASLQAQYTQGTVNGTDFVALTKDCLNAIFDPLVNRLQVAASTLADQKLRPLIDRRQHFWIADVYAECPGYVASYKAFLDGQPAALAKLEAIRAAPSHPLRSALDSAQQLHRAKRERFSDYGLEDLLWYCSARVAHLHRLCASQHALWQETQRARCDLVSAKFFTDYGRDLDDADLERAFYAELHNMQDPQQWAFSCTTGWTRSRGMPEPAGSKALEALATASASVNAAFQAKDVERSVVCDPLCQPLPLPRAAKRRFMQRLPARMIDGADYGLAAETPVWLLLFTDVLVVAMANDRTSASSKETYRMAAWLNLRSINVVAMDTPDGRRVHRLTSHIPEDGSVTHSDGSGGGGSSSNSGCNVAVAVEIASKDFEVWAGWNLTFMNLSKECTGVARTPRAAGGYPTVGMNLVPLVALEARRHPTAALGGIPLLVSRAIGGILSYGLGEEGILRLSCEKQQAADVLAAADKGAVASISFTKDTVHVATAVFKQFLRALPEPLIPYAFYDDFIALADDGEGTGNSSSNSSPHKVQRLIALVKGIPEPYKTVLQEVCHLFYVISCSSDLNKMTPANVAIAAGVSLLRRPPSGKSGAPSTSGITDLNKSATVVEMLVQEYPSVFGLSRPFWGTPGRSVISWGSGCPTPYVGLLHKHVNAIPLAHLALQESASGMAAVWAVDALGTVTLYDPDGGYRVVERRATGFRDPMALLSADRFLCVSAAAERGLFALDTDRFCDEGPESCAPVARIDGPPARCAIVVDGEASGAALWCGAENAVTVASGETLAVLRVIDLRAGSPSSLPAPGIQGPRVVTCMAQVNSTVWCGVHAPGGNAQWINVYDARTFALVASFPAHRGRITALCPIVNEGGHCARVWSGSEDGGVIIWDVASKTTAAALPRAHSGGITAMCMVGAGTVWTSGKDGAIRIWGTKSLRFIGGVCGYHTLPVTSIIRLETSLKTKGYIMIWTASMDGSVCVWKVLQFPANYLQ